MKHLAWKYRANSNSKNGNKNHPLSHFYTISLPPALGSQTDGEGERQGGGRQVRGRGKGKNNNNLTSNILLHIVSSDFEMRLVETQVNEEKWQTQYTISRPIKHEVSSLTQ